MSTITNKSLFFRYVFIKNTVIFIFIFGLFLSFFFNIKDTILLVFTPVILTLVLYEYFFHPSFISIKKINEGFEIYFYYPENKYFYVFNERKLKKIVINHDEIEFIVVKKIFGLNKLIIRINDNNSNKFLKPIDISWLRLDRFQEFLEPKLLFQK